MGFVSALKCSTSFYRLRQNIGKMANGSVKWMVDLRYAFYHFNYFLKSVAAYNHLFDCLSAGISVLCMFFPQLFSGEYLKTY
jgi:hypothetical protein